MKINTLHIENFRAIKNLDLKDLNDTVVIAGSNGCGKTQIYNAIRLLKSAYGGYQPNEYQHWFGEFQINLNKPNETIYRVFRDRSKPIIIQSEFELTADEISYLRAKAEGQTRNKIWQQLIPELQHTGFMGGVAYANAQRIHGATVEQRVKEELADLEICLTKSSLFAELIIEPDLTSQTKDNIALELLFSTYEPGSLGVIDYHGAQRNYNREQLGGINLNIDQSEERGRQHSLYNWTSKYSNIKSELATGYIRDLIAKQAGGNAEKATPLVESLKELFSTFFPGKQFKGPSPGPDGTLDFPVQVGRDTLHDIDDLSSGEKEVLFGYLRLRNNAPKNSIILIDEPELHLNPALLQGLPQFYHKYIGKDLGNQLWLVTHSDALLRESVGQPGFSVFHMQQALATELNENQVKAIDAGEPLGQAIIDLIGDLATYQPGKKVVIFEGGGDVDFDVRMTTTLFPRLRTEVTCLSAGDKGKVRNLHQLLKNALEKGAIQNRFFSIVDRDSGTIERTSDSFMWDRYHIENYLLVPKYILQVMQDLNIESEILKTEADVKAELILCATETLDDLVRHELEQQANMTIVSAIKTATKREDREIAQALSTVIISTQKRIESAISESLSLEKLSKQEMILRNKYKQHLKSDLWLETFRGRDILKTFVGKHVDRINYEVFRDWILAKMRDDNHKPVGMSTVVTEILRST